MERCWSSRWTSGLGGIRRAARAVGSPPNCGMVSERPLHRGWARWSCRYRSLQRRELFPSFCDRAPERATDGGHPGSVDRRDVDAQSRRTGSSARHDGHRQESSVRLCRDIDERVKSFRSSPWRANGRLLWLDATYLKVRQEAVRAVSVAAIIASGVSQDGRRYLGLGLGDSGPKSSDGLSAGFAARA